MVECFALINSRNVWFKLTLFENIMDGPNKVTLENLRIQTQTDLIESSKHLRLTEMGQDARCRICLEDSPKLIKACFCKGSMELVHQKCLMEWIIVKQERVFNTYDGVHRSTSCQICQMQIQFEATHIRKCSAREFKRKIRQFPVFFVAHTIFLLLLIAPAIILTCSLLETLKNDSLDKDIAAITIESTILALILLTFLKMFLVWIGDYIVSRRLRILKVYHLAQNRNEIKD